MAVVALLLYLTALALAFDWRTFAHWRRTGDTGLRLDAGTAATLAAQLAMGASWRIGVDSGERTALVTGDPSVPDRLLH
ncbi:hypothetical protein [Planomonospora algeriensis]